MIVGIMQPYFFPYIGYFQLIAAVNKFVIYDDVNFIKGGWINRNNILINKKSSLFTVPLVKVSSNTLINDTKINLKFYNVWKVKFLRSLEHSYKKAPCFTEVYNLIENVLEINENDLISKLAVNSIKNVIDYLQLDTEICETLENYNNKTKNGQERILDICRVEQASQYINPIGGIELYSKNTFKENGIVLNFVKSKPIVYTQFDNNFSPWLSIIDVLMFNSVSDVNKMINQYELV
jgi:hypothetical protein